MIRLPFLFALPLFFSLTMDAAESSTTVAKGVQLRPYTGWDQSLFLYAKPAHIYATVVPAIGARVLNYSVNGDNIIFENPAGAGKTLATSKTPFSVGGYQCDLGPEIRGIPDHPALWMGPWQWRALRAYTLITASGPDPTLGVQLEKEIVIDPDTGELGIIQRMKNTSAQETNFCLWDRTLCKNDGFAFFRLNPKSRFAAGWSMRRTIDGKYVYDGDHPSSPQVKILDGVLVARANGPATKVGADSTAGWIAYVRGKVLLIKFFPYLPNGNYSDGGNSVELYFDPRVAELEPLSPEIRLNPGGDYSFPEKWSLILLEKEVSTFDQARTLVGRVPLFQW